MANIKEKKGKSGYIYATIILLADLLIIPLFAYVVHVFLLYKSEAPTIITESLKSPLLIYVKAFSTTNVIKLFLICQGVILLLILKVLIPKKLNLEDTTETIKVANFEIPKPTGKGQMGTSRFTTEEEKKEIFKVWEEGTPLDSGGMILGEFKEKGKMHYYYDDEDVNTLMLGASRSGKGRREYLPSIYLIAESGENMFINDPKGELFIYTNEYLKQKGYKVLNIDFKFPEKSMRYNYLYYINKDFESNQIDDAIEKIWDLVGLFVGEPKGERLWSDGHASVLASAIAYICMETPKEFRNLTNVYMFIANTCKMNEEGEMLINEIYSELHIEHPARVIFAVAEVASPKTRASFFTSSLASLRLFTDNKTAYMTSDTDIDLNILGSNEKVVLFCTVPDEKKTKHILSTILIDQLYINLVAIADKCGGRLERRVNMLVDEFGNLPKINGLDNKTTVCLGRGIRFIFGLQAMGQLYEIYGKDVAEIITGNCHDWIYLLTTDTTSAEVISKKTGPYTVQSKSVSSSTNLDKGNDVNYSSSANLVRRNLLESDEVCRLKMPYSLVFHAREFPSMFELYDISNLKPNKLFGMGSKKHNIKLTIERQNAREKREIRPVPIWVSLNEKINKKGTSKGNEQFKEIEELEINNNEISFID